MAISWIFLISAHVPQCFKMHHVCVHAWSRLPQLRSLYVRQRDMLGTHQGALVWKPSNRSTSFIWKTRIGDAVIFEERGNDTLKDRRSQGHLGCWRNACSPFKQLGTFLCVICAQLLLSEFTGRDSTWSIPSPAKMVLRKITQVKGGTPRTQAPVTHSPYHSQREATQIQTEGQWMGSIYTAGGRFSWLFLLTTFAPLVKATSIVSIFLCPALQ